MLNTILLIAILVVAVAILAIMFYDRIQDEKDFTLHNKLMDCQEDNRNLYDYIDYIVDIIDKHNEDIEKGENLLHYTHYSNWLAHRLVPDERDE